MKKTLVAVTVMFAAWILSTPAFAGNLKIGWVDVQTILNSTAEGKRLRKQLEEEFNKKKEKIEEQKKQLDKMEEELNRQRLVLSKEALQKKEMEFQMKRAELGKLIMKSQSDMQKRDKEFSERMLKKITQVVTKIGVEKNYDLILEKNGSVLYSKKGMEITDSVISLYNKMNR